MTVEIVSVDSADVPWDDLAAAPDRTVGQSRAWLGFLADTQGATPAIGRVHDGDRELGWFTGAVVRRGGIRQLGSPLPGWTTSAMGFTLVDGADRTAALAALPAFARSQRCWHLEVADRALVDPGLVPEGYAIDHLRGYETPIAGRDDDDLMTSLAARGRRYVRRAERNGVTVEVVDPDDPGDFAGEFHRQLRAAFAKRGLEPTYPRSRVESLITRVGPTGQLLLLRARTPEGRPAATGIFTGVSGGTAEFWGGASERATQHLLPNDAVMWEAMRIWRDRGAEQFNFGGGGTYKTKYGGLPHDLPWLRWSRVGALEQARRIAVSVRSARRHRLARRRTPDSPAASSDRAGGAT